MSENHGEKFKRFLKDNKIGVTKAAETLGVSRQTVYQYFDSVKFEDDTLKVLVEKFGNNLSQLFEKQDSSKIINELKDDIIRLQREAIEREKEINKLKGLLLDKSLVPDKNIVDD